MPFQGNPNAGAPDPGIIQLLFSERARREERDYQRARDAMAAQQAQAKFLMEQEAAAKKEARDDEIHRLDVMAKKADVLAKQQTALGGVEDRAAAVPEETRSTAIQQAAVQAAPSNNVVRSNLTGSEADMRALNQLAGTDPQAVLAQTQQLNDILAKTGDPVLDQFLADMSAQQKIPVSQLRTSSGVEAGVRAMAEQKALQDKIAEEKRAEAKEDRLGQRRSARARANSFALAREQASIAAGADVNEIMEREKSIKELRDTLKREDLSPGDRELFTSQYKALMADAESDLVRGVDPAAFRVRRDIAKENQKYDKLHDSTDIIKKIRVRLEAGDTSEVGVRAAFNELVGNFASIYEEATGESFSDFYNDSINEVLSRDDITDKQREQFMEEFANQDVLDRIASGRITEADIRWTIMYSLNTDGRVSNLLSEQMRKRSEFIGFGIGPKTALARIRALEGRMNGLLSRQRDFISDVTKGEELFEPKTGRRVRASRFDELALDGPFSSPSSKPIPKSTAKTAEAAADAILGAE